MFFVVSTGRSGSQTIARVLSQSPDCICLHEPEPSLVKEATLYQYGLIADEVIRSIFVETRPPIMDGKIYGESNLKLSSLIPLLAQTFPQAQFIWLVRDGRDVVASTYYARGWYRPMAELQAENPKPKTNPMQNWHRFRLRGDLVGAMTPDEWEALSRFEKNCWLWTWTNTNIQSHLSLLPPERWRMARLETLFDDLPAICSLIGIKPPVGLHSEYHNVSNVAPTVWEDWPADQRAAFQQQCGALMDLLYPHWQEPGQHARRTAPPVTAPKPLPWWRRFGAQNRRGQA